MEYFNYLGSMETNNARRICKIESRIAKTNAAFNGKNILFTSKWDLHLRKK